MKTVITTVFGTVFLGVVGALIFIYTGVYDVSASSPHMALSNWAMSKTMHESVERRARYIQAPELEKEELILVGVNDFEAMCVGCHGAPGKDPEPMGQGLNPPAPDLQQSAQHLSAAELFWVTKHGIKMTGMPSWGATHSDEDLWPVVALMAALPDLNADDYSELLLRAKGKGHHSVSEVESVNANGGHDTEEAEADGHHHAPVKVEKNIGSTHDHSTHDH